MDRNVGSWDRILRGVAGLALLAYTVVAPFALPLKLVALALPGVYLLGTTLVGTCLGYRLIGRSTCPRRT